MKDTTKKLLITILKTAIILILAYFLLKISIYFLPFIIAFIISTIIEPIILFLNKRLRIPRKIGSVLSILMVLSLFSLLIGFLISKLVEQIKNVYNNLPATYKNLEQLVSLISSKANDFVISLPKEYSFDIDKWINSIFNDISNLIKPIVEGTINFAVSLPQLLVFTIVTILASYFISSDRVVISMYLKKQLPESWINNV